MRPSILASFLCAICAWSDPIPAQDDWPGAEDAFLFQAHRESEQLVRLHIDIAPGYALYRAKFRIDGGYGVRITKANYPDGHWEDDAVLGPREIYTHPVDIEVVGELSSHASGLQVTYQGCLIDVVCFNPISALVQILPKSPNIAQ